MADTLYLISTVSFVLAAICLVASIAIFIVYKIPDVIGDLSGKNAKKSIKQFREANEKSGNKSFRPSKTNDERGKLTETAHGLKGLDYTSEIDNDETGILSENIYKNDEMATELLVEDNGTELLTEGNETELLSDDNETTLLSEDNETASLLDEEIIEQDVNNNPIERIEILDEVIIIHTDKII